MTSRRDFLRAASAAAILSPALLRGESDKLGTVLPQRMFGATGEKVTAFGLGGHHVGKGRDEKRAQALIERAIERGVRFFDNAVNYQSGRSETYYGRFLSPKFRDHVFITTKSSKSTAKDLDPTIITARNMHEYAYSLPVACMLSGCETVEQIDENTAILENFQPMDETRRVELVAAVKPVSGPDLEYYKRRI